MQNSAAFCNALFVSMDPANMFHVGFSVNPMYLSPNSFYAFIETSLSLLFFNLYFFWGGDTISLLSNVDVSRYSVNNTNEM